MSPVQMITILKRNTSLHNIKYLHPIKCIPKKKRKTNNFFWKVHMYFLNMWQVQQNGMWALHVYICFWRKEVQQFQRLGNGDSWKVKTIKQIENRRRRGRKRGRLDENKQKLPNRKNEEGGKQGANPGGQVDWGHTRSSDENKGVRGRRKLNSGPRIHAIQVEPLRWGPILK